MIKIRPFLFVLLLTGISCRKDIPLSRQYPAKIYDVHIQDTLDIKVRYNLTIFFEKENPCAIVKEAEWEEKPGEVSYKLLLDYDGMPCAFDTNQGSFLENYQATQIGELIFRFYQDEDTWLQKKSHCS